MTKAELMKRYNSRKDECCVCGCLLTAMSCLGDFFVMDYNGNFYCPNCEEGFEDGDERIFEPDLYEESEQRCDLCAKEGICPKSANPENYSLGGGCSDFQPNGGVRFCMFDAYTGTNLGPVNIDPYDLTDEELEEAAEDSYNNTIRSLIEVTADRNDLVRRLREAYKMLLDMLKGAETGAMYAHVRGLLDKLNKEYSEVL